jgi:hypothetical protein
VEVPRTSLESNNSHSSEVSTPGYSFLRASEGPTKYNQKHKEKKKVALFLQVVKERWLL